MISALNIAYLRRQVLVEDVLLGRDASHVGSVQAPDADVAFTVALLYPVWRLSVQVSADESLGHTLGGVLSLTRSVPTKDDDLIEASQELIGIRPVRQLVPIAHGVVEFRLNLVLPHQEEVEYLLRANVLDHLQTLPLIGRRKRRMFLQLIG